MYALHLHMSVTLFFKALLLLFLLLLLTTHAHFLQSMSLG